MTLLRKAGLALLLAAVVLVAGQVLVFAQGLPGLLWPALLLRVALLALTVPALIFKFWCGLHLGISPNILLLVWALFVAYAALWTGFQRLRATVDMPMRPGRRAFLAGTGVAAASTYGAAHSYPLPSLTRRELPLRDLPSSLAGLRLVLLADLHRGPSIGRDYLEQVVRQVNALNPDIVLLPGDFVSKSSAYFPDITAILSQLRPRIASVATLGNHDHWEGAELAKQAISRAGVMMLHNRSVHLNEDRSLSTSGSRGLCLVGIDDLTTGEPDLEAALAGQRTSGIPRILLAHNPDYAEQQAALDSPQRVDLQVSGHTHGGQVVLPGVGPVVSGSKYGMKYLSGWVQGPRWPVFVTRGVGASVIPVRIGAPPEIVIFDLQTAPA